MNKVYNTNRNKFIVYNRNQISNKTNLCVIFLHGLLSNKNGAKAIYLENICISKNIDFIRFDNFGHGDSSGIFLEETIGSWLEGLELIVREIIPNKELILVGSSMGGWISLLFSIKYPKLVKGLIGLAAAPDFTETAIWQKLPKVKQQEMKEQGWLEISGHNCNQKYPISYNLITEARKYCILNLNIIPIRCPVHLIHGISDIDVPYSNSQNLLSKISSDNIVLKLIKGADHKLSRESDLKVIANSLAEILSLD